MPHRHRSITHEKSFFVTGSGITLDSVCEISGGWNKFWRCGESFTSRTCARGGSVSRCRHHCCLIPRPWHLALPRPSLWSNLFLVVIEPMRWLPTIAAARGRSLPRPHRIRDDASHRSPLPTPSVSPSNLNYRSHRPLHFLPTSLYLP